MSPRTPHTHQCSRHTHAHQSIEDWDNKSAARLPNDVVQRLDLLAVDSLYLVEIWGSGGPRLIPSNTP